MLLDDQSSEKRRGKQGVKNVVYKGYLLDLDGTMYRGDTVIEGAADFVGYLQQQGLPYLFVTNNSSATEETIAAKLNRLGIAAAPNQIVTSAVAAAAYIASKKQSASVYVIGERGLEEAICRQGCQLSENEAEYVVVGIDRTITYDKIAAASLLIQSGAEFISTNKDPAIPDERGMLPGNGAITAAIETASGKAPLYIGKPGPIILQSALDRMGLEVHDVLMVGDNYLTDIQAGIQLGMDTLMVLTGYSSPADIKRRAGEPTYMAANLTEWLQKNGTC